MAHVKKKKILKKGKAPFFKKMLFVVWSGWVRPAVGQQSTLPLSAWGNVAGADGNAWGAPLPSPFC